MRSWGRPIPRDADDAAEAERAARKLRRETLEQASRSFRIDGALIIENIADAEIIPDELSVKLTLGIWTAVNTRMRPRWVAGGL